MVKNTIDLDNVLGRLIGKTRRAWLQCLNDNLSNSGYNLNAEEFIIIMHLSYCNNLRQQDFARILGRDKTYVTRALDRLEKQKLLARVPDERDRRQKLLCLTPKGRKLVRSLGKLARETIEQAEAGIKPSDLKICKQVLHRVYENLSS